MAFPPAKCNDKWLLLEGAYGGKETRTKRQHFHIHIFRFSEQNANSEMLISEVNLGINILTHIDVHSKIENRSMLR